MWKVPSARVLPATRQDSGVVGGVESTVFSGDLAKETLVGLVSAVWVVVFSSSIVCGRLGCFDYKLLLALLWSVFQMNRVSCHD